MRMRNGLLLSIAAVFALASPVFANIYIPSFVQLITAPLLWSIYLFTLIVTVPVIVGVAAIEALVLRRYIKGFRFRDLLFRLSVINAGTTMVGAVTMPTGTEIWPGIVIAFVLTTVIEAFLLILGKQPLATTRSLWEVYCISTRMNAASYSVLAITLLSLIYLPSMLSEDSRVADDLKGQLVIFTGRGVNVVSLDRRPYSMSSSVLASTAAQGFVLSTSGKNLLGSADDGKSLVRLDVGGVWPSKALPLPTQVKKVYGISPDERLLCCSMNDRLVIYDRTLGRIAFELPEELSDSDYAAFSFDNSLLIVRHDVNAARHSSEDDYEPDMRLVDLKTRSVRKLGEVWDVVFSPVRRQLAWNEGSIITVYDHDTGRRSIINVPGSVFSNLAWSPDGKHIAYAGHLNPFTAQRFESDVRVVDVRTKRSVTVYPQYRSVGMPCDLYWLR